MATIKGIEVSGTIYDTEDETARTSANSALSTATNAQTTATNAQATAETAQTTAETAQTTAETAQTTAETADEKVGNLTDLETTIKTDVVSSINEINEKNEPKVSGFLFNSSVGEEGENTLLFSTILQQTKIDIANAPVGSGLIVRFYNSYSSGGGSSFSNGGEFIKTASGWVDFKAESSVLQITETGLVFTNPSSSNPRYYTGFIHLYNAYINS